MTAASKQTIQHLASQLRRMERGVSSAKGAPHPLSTGISALDDLLPERGVFPGSLVEWLSPGGGGGTATLAFKVAAQLMREYQNCVVIDPSQSFFPFAGSLDRLTVIHPAEERDTLWAWEQTLRCSAAGVVVGWLEDLTNQTYRRLQLAVETGGGIGLLIRPALYRSQPSWADLRFSVETVPSDVKREAGSTTNSMREGRLLKVELVHCRGRAAGGTVELEVDDETGDVCLVSSVAPATTLVGAATG